jgi:tetratricopeptide (TPR) repeat protein
MINLFKAKRFEDLIGKGRVLIKKFPNQIIFYNITSLAYDAIGKRVDAKNLLKKALDIEPNNFNVLNNLGLVSANSDENKEAEFYYKKALELRPNFLDALINFGNLKMSQNQNEEAKKFFISALKINNKIIAAKISLAGYYERSGDFEEAKSLYLEILKENPDHTVADKSISLIHKYKKNDPHLKMMEEKLKKGMSEEDIKRVSFALGKAYEDIGEYKNSFNCYRAGNAIHKKNSDYNIRSEIKLFKKIKETFEDNKISSLKNGGQKLIFIVGMPRSGTTLTEQILSSHNLVFGAGELSFLTESIEKRFLDKKGGTIEDVYPLKQNMLKEIKEEYLEKIKMFNNNKKYLIDKAPLNFRWIGFIMLIFPNAKIIHCNRDSIDTCWSNYKNSFSSSLMDYTYDFDDLAKYYKIYDDLMNFWNKKFSDKIYNLFYEELVANKKIEIKKLLNFCELDWDDNCLNFHKNKKLVSTASLAQVRQPLYNSSIEKWKNYSDQIKDLKRKLTE